MIKHRLAILALATGLLTQGEVKAQDPFEAPIETAASGESDWEAIKEEHVAMKAAFDAQTAAAEARKKMIEVEMAVRTAKYTVPTPSSPHTGDVKTTQLKLGDPEASILTSMATIDVANQIYCDITQSLSRTPPNGQPRWQLINTLVIATGLTGPQFADLLVYESKFKEVEQLFLSSDAAYKAAIASERASQTESEPDARSAFQSVGLALKAASDLGSYFRSDYEFGTPSFVYEDSSLAFEIARRLGNDVSANDIKIVLPQVITVSDFLAIKPSLDRLSMLSARSRAWKEQAIVKETWHANANRPAIAQSFTSAKVSIEAALTAYRQLYASFSEVNQATSTTNQATPTTFLSRVLSQAKLKEALGINSAVLYLESSGNSQFYLKKNLWTFFGGPPIHVAGTVAAKYALTAPSTGEVIAAGTAFSHGGYKTLRKVEAIKRNSPTCSVR